MNPDQILRAAECIRKRDEYDAKATAVRKAQPGFISVTIFPEGQKTNFPGLHLEGREFFEFRDIVLKYLQQKREEMEESLSALTPSPGRATPATPKRLWPWFK